MSSYTTPYIARITPTGTTNTWLFSENSVSLPYIITDDTPSNSTLSGAITLTGTGVASGRNYSANYIGQYNDGVVIYVPDFNYYYLLSQTRYSVNTIFTSIPAPLIICFTVGTIIDTVSGPKLVENLAPGDLIRTKDHGYQPLRWMGTKTLSALDLLLNPQLRPIRISAGALGHKIPATDLTVSPQHRILLRSDIISSTLGHGEVLVPAKKLLDIPGVGIDSNVSEVTYVHLLLDRHEVIFANGTETESLFTGPEALKAIPEASRQEVKELFPELVMPDYVVHPARPLPKGRQLKDALLLHKARRHCQVVCD